MQRAAVTISNKVVLYSDNKNYENTTSYLLNVANIFYRNMNKKTYIFTFCGTSIRLKRLNIKDNNHTFSHLGVNDIKTL